LALNSASIVQQSKNALAQWGKQWTEHAKIHSKYPQKSLDEFKNHGVGKALVICATGYSLEQNMDMIIKHRDNIDLMVCDKSLGILLDKGIEPDFCMVCDANVSHEKYCNPWAEQLQNTVLFQNVCGNPEWTEKGNWKDIYFFVNEDAIKSEKKFGPLTGSTNFIPAGTNVSNAMLVLICQSRNDARLNFFGYDKILLVGFDYCWHPQGKYYAYNEDGGGKKYFMKHVCLLDKNGEYVYTSNNLLFSAQWGEQYISTFSLPVVNCSQYSILGKCTSDSLENHITYSYKKEDRKIVREKVKKMSLFIAEMTKIEKELKKIGNDHWKSFQQSI